jgi:serine/threonine protein kinase/tetratricopeptide (TPR) repeat protein
MADWKPRANELFLRAFEIEPADERRAFLDVECGRDTDLRREVDSLLTAGANLGDFMGRPLLPFSISPSPSPAKVEDRLAESGGELGDFRILREVGRGGMGVVYEAVQLSLGRRVALKVLPFASTLDAKQLQRFKNEAQAAAQLHHTNIVPVHATGCERGVHYYAMQFIEGRTVADLIRELRQLAGLENRRSRLESDEFSGAGFPPSSAASGGPRKETPAEAQAGQLDYLLTSPDTPTGDWSEKTKDRKSEPKETPPTLRNRDSGAETLSSHSSSAVLHSRTSPFFLAVANLAIQAAEALEHAHQLGVVHRDIKPANLIIESLDSIGPKGEGARLWITDFGVAHCRSQAGLTMSGDLVGTLRYMSPEQALAKRALVDHRTDIYSLGATLYELLTLEPVYPGTDQQELLRQIAFEEPRPLRGINKSIPTELETIVLKSMGKSPEERYGTAQELAEDVRRYLQHEPILAKKPTWIQRANKWARRHPTVVRSAVVVLVLITAGSLLSTWLIWQEKKRTGLARDRAESNEKLAIEQQHRAEEQEQIQRAVRNFLAYKLLLQADPVVQADALRLAGRSVAETKWNPTIGELLDRAASQLTPDKLEAQFPGQPVIQADILQTIGYAYDSIGAPGPAIAHLERARNLLESELGLDRLDTLICQNNLAVACQHAGKLPEALRLFEQLREREVQSLGPDHRVTLITSSNLGVVYKDSYRTGEAIQLLERVREKQIENFGPDDPETLNTINNLAVAYQAAKKLPEAIRLFEKLRDQRIQKQGLDYPETLITLGNLACAYRDVKRFSDAIRLFEQVRDKQVQQLSPDHPETLTTKDNLARTYQESGKLAEAILLSEEVFSKRLTRLGPDHPHTRITLDRLSHAYLEAGRVPDAIRLIEQMRDKLIEKVGPDDPLTLNTQNNLAHMYWVANQLDRSVPLFEQVLKKMKAKLGENHPDTLNAQANLAVNYIDARRPNEAVPLLEDALSRVRKLPSPNPPEVARFSGLLAWAYDQAGQVDKAEPLHRESLEQARRHLGADHMETAKDLVVLGLNLLRQNKSADAEAVIREGLAIYEKKEPDAWLTFNAMSVLGGALLAQKKYADAERMLLQGYEGMKQREAMIPPVRKVRMTEALDRLVRLYEAKGQKDKAEEWRQKLAEQKKK